MRRIGPGVPSSRGPNEREALSPPVVLGTVDAGAGRRVLVARDDLLPGGTKQRACAPLLAELASQGFTEFHYASPFAGFAQVALAYVCSRLNLECHLSCEADRTNVGSQLTKHEFTKLAESYGARIRLTGSLAKAEEQAAESALASQRAHKIPLGFNCLEFTDALERELRRQWMQIVEKIGTTPRRLWLPVGSGTLANVFRRIVCARTEILCVNVRVLPAGDERIHALASNPRFTMFSAPEKFHERADLPPEFPSNVHYDGKLWQFLKRYGQDGDLWWNVAR